MTGRATTTRMLPLTMGPAPFLQMDAIGRAPMRWDVPTSMPSTTIQMPPLMMVLALRIPARCASEM